MTERVSTWRIRELTSRPNLASVLAEVNRAHMTGRVLIHFFGGSVVAIEICERAPADDGNIASDQTILPSVTEFA